MSQLIGIFLTIALTWNIACSTKSIQVKATVPNAENHDTLEFPDESSVENLEYQKDQNYHYAFLCNFYEDSMELISVKKQEGSMSLIVSSASELFLAGYIDGILVNYYRFADPLETHGIDHQATSKKTKSAQAFLLMPKNIETNINNKTFELAVYRIGAYIENFSDQIQSLRNLNKLISDKKIDILHRLDTSRIKELVNK